MTALSRKSLVPLSVAVGIVVACIGAWRAGAVSATKAPASPTAVAVVDLQRLFEDLEEVKAENGKLQVTGNARQAELSALAEEVKRLENQLGLMAKDSPDRRDTASQLRIKRGQTEITHQTLQALINLEKGDLLRRIYLKVITAIDDFAVDEGYDIILLDDRRMPVPDQGSDAEMIQAIQNRRVLYAVDAVDITSQIVTKMNNEFNK